MLSDDVAANGALRYPFPDFINGCDGYAHSPPLTRSDNVF
ncbi:unknow [Vibrio campbellii]|nr:unknow [Vibrio campbellii]